MPSFNEATDTDPCLILAGTSLKVVKDSSNPAGSGGSSNFLQYYYIKYKPR